MQQAVGARPSGELTKKNSDGTYKNVERFVKILKYYGIDGVGVNSEFNASAATMKQIRGFFAECHKEAEKIGWKFQLHWYDGTNDYGSITFDQGLGAHNKAQFGDKDNIVTDMMFSNYNNLVVLSRTLQHMQRALVAIRTTTIRASISRAVRSTLQALTGTTSTT